ncbi:MAG TPA: DUF1015 family protein [Saprospiraceae bacterium]|nr:DUF1015 family protein [Saprospiraceae bacterium]
MQLHPFRATIPNLKFITSPDAFFSSVKEDYLEYAASGFFQTTEQPALYIYQIEKHGRVFSGLVAGVDMDRNSDREIIPHEQTLSTKEQRQIHLLLKRKATVKPILLTYETVNGINFLLHELCQNEPLLAVSFRGEKERHIIWALKDPDKIQQIQTLFDQQVPRVYIADGHHRCATARRLSNGQQSSPYGRTICALFPTTDLEIHDFNRLIEAFTSISPTFFMAQLSRYCIIEYLSSPQKPDRKHELVLYLNEEWYRLRWKRSVFERFHQETLDALLMNELILRDILGIKDVSNSPRIDYIEGPKGLEGLKRGVDKNNNNIGIALYPVQTHELFKLANERVILPPKSTWFEPRLINGLINYQYM